MTTDRSADLHYAYQFGQDAARGDYETCAREFNAKFGDDPEAASEFAAGFRAESVRQARLQ